MPGGRKGDQKPTQPPLELQVHETGDVECVYGWQLISYNVEPDERAHAYLGVPLKLDGKANSLLKPGIGP